MPLYSFSGAHQGTDRPLAGQIQALNEAAARSSLARRSIAVESLVEVQMQLPPSPALAPTRAPRNLTPLALTMMLTGLVWLAVSTHAAGTRSLIADQLPGGRASKSAIFHIHLQVKGRLQTPPGGFDLSACELRLHYPDIPYDLTRRGPELSLDSEGRFCVEQDVKLRRKPRRVWASCRAPGWVTVELRDIPVDEQTSASELPPILLLKAAARS